jgi:hypothetical protein
MVLNYRGGARLVSGFLLGFEVLKSGDPTHENEVRSTSQQIFRHLNRGHSSSTPS